MNVMNVLVPEVTSQPSIKGARQQQTNESSSFQSFLQFEGNSIDESTTDNETNNFLSGLDSDQKENLINLVNSLFDTENLSIEELFSSEELVRTLENYLNDIENDEDVDTATSEMLNQLQLLLQDTTEMNDNEKVEENFVIKVTNSTEIVPNPIETNEIVQLLTEINRLFDDETISLKEKASEVLAMLRQWSMLKGQSDEEQMNKILDTELSEKNATIWKQLVEVYEKRNHFTNNNVYQTNSTVTRSDVMNWLQLAFNRYDTQIEKVTTPTVAATHQPMPMSEIQQYTIHVTSLDRVDKVSDEIMTQFNNIIRKSNFLKTDNMNQLSITLRPDNLGSMTVRFTQVDGEMIVKIIVTTQAAKNMLESNIHQLKHMFSPHQVTIERDETISDEEFFQQEEEQKNNEEESLKEGNESNENKEEKTPDIDFKDVFQQISEEEI